MANCQAGEIRRKAYDRKAYTRKDGTRVKAVHVKSACVPDKGKRGKTPASKRVLPVLVPGNLGMYGYSNVKTTAAAARHSALTKAVKDVGYAMVIRRVNVVANFNKNSDPRVHKIMRGDIKWMQVNLAPVYSKVAQRRGSESSSKRGSKKLVKAGKKLVAGRSRQLYHVSGSTHKFYRYHKKDGTMGRRYVSDK